MTLPRSSKARTSNGFQTDRRSGAAGLGKARAPARSGLARLRAAVIPVALVAAVVVAANWWRGPQPDLRTPPAEHTAAAGELLEHVTAFLSGSQVGTAQAPVAGTWFVTAYARDGSATVTVRAEGPVEQWAAPLRTAWPGQLQVDRALDGVPGARAGPGGFGLDVGLDGWIEHSGRIHTPVSFLQTGFDRGRLARFVREHPGQPLRTWAWAQTRQGPLWLVRHSVDPGPLTPALLRERMDLGATYLTRHLKSDSSYDYAWNARSGLPESGYNLLRHAGTTYSLFQVYRVTRRPPHYRAAERALEYLRARRRFDSSDRGRCFQLEGDKVKLGGAGLTLLALVEQAKARPDGADWEWMHCLAAHIVSQTDPSGDMASFYTDQGRYRWSSHRSAYYPGEAVLGLMQLYAIDPQPRWLECARRAADFLVHQRWVAWGIRVHVPLDAWLIQALDRLVAETGDAAYLEYAFAIGRAIAREQRRGAGVAPDLQGSPANPGWPSVVATGSRGEALAAAARLERRFRPGHDFFLERLKDNTHFALRNQYTAPVLTGIRRPAAAYGGFRSSPADPVIRIDGVQHNLSALIGLLQLLEEVS